MDTAAILEPSPPQVSPATVAARRELCNLLLGAIGDVVRFGGAPALGELDGIEKKALIVQRQDNWFLALTNEQLLDQKTLIWSLYVPELLALSTQHRDRWAHIQSIAYDILFLHYLNDIYPFVAESSSLSIFRFRVAYNTPQEVAAARQSMDLIITDVFVSRLIRACRKVLSGAVHVGRPADLSTLPASPAQGV